ncbi:MAG: LamG-like jellyroll fold domain-containing protein [Acidiferrobacterales bacterium]
MDSAPYPPNNRGYGSRVGGGTSNDYSASAVKFGGTNEYLLRGADYTGSVDGNSGTITLWVKFEGGDGSSQVFFDQDNGSTNTLFFNRNADGTIRLILRASDDTTLLFIETDLTVEVADGWTCILASWELDGTPTSEIFIRDVQATLTVTTEIEGTVDHTVSDHSFGASINGTNKVNGCVADVYFNPKEYINFLVESNRRKIISALGKPVGLGSDGSKPTGTAPILLLTGDTATWHTNAGSGGGMTENGTLTDCPDSPSD